MEAKEKIDLTPEETEEEISLELDESSEEEKVEEVETFQAQLVKALELNDKLIAELQNKEEEISMFSSVKNNLEGVIEQKNAEIERLQEEVEAIEMEKFQEKVQDMSSRWVKKFGIPADKSDEIVTMLSKFQNEQELDKFESIMGLSKSTKSNPVPLTKNSDVLSEKFSDEKKDVQSLSPKEKINRLHEQFVAYENLKAN